MPVAARLKAGLCALVLVLSACDQPGEPPAPAPAETAPGPEESAKLTPREADALSRFQSGASELLRALAVCTDTFTTLGEQFLNQPQEAHLDSLKAQWQGCYDRYQASTMLTGFSPDQRELLRQWRQRLGSPLTMPGFIDSIQGYPHSGIVNDASLPLTVEALREQQGLTDDAEVSTGFQVVEFLLWGEGADNPDLPPRPVSDYQEIQQWPAANAGLPVSEHPNNRRRRLLALELAILAEDSQGLLAAWQSGNLPPTQAAAHTWRLQQAQAVLSALEANPDNAVLREYLQRWVQQQVIPLLPPGDPDTDLESRLTQALEVWLKAPPSPGRTTP